MPDRPGRVALAVYAIVLAVLIAASTPRIIGDGREYLAVADRLSGGAPPSLTRADALRFGISDGLLRAADGRVDTIHFWAYPALAAAPLAAANAAGLDPAWAFTAVNLVLLMAAAVFAARFLHWSGFVVLFLGPVIWWTDKVHTEAFTFSLLTLAMSAASEWPLVAAAALGLAAAQNPPIVVLLVLVGVGGLAVRGERRRASLGLVLGLAIAALHPLYYWLRLGRLVPLAETTAAPLSPQSFGAVLVDANIGIVFNAPFFALAVLLTIALGLSRGWWRMNRWAAAAAASGMVWLALFGRVVNINHGGTPGMSRHALWILPLAVPFLPRPPLSSTETRLFGVLALLSSLWSVAYFRPSVAENFLTPTRASAWLWTRHPTWTNPPPEIFAERLRHRENVLPGTAASPGCAKILLWDGIGPEDCARMAAPAKCERGPCYANRRADGSYAFVVAP